MRTKPGLKVFGLSALVLGVMAIGIAGVAQAETGACWGYESGGLKCFSSTLETKPLLSIEGEGATLLVGNWNMEITCKTAAFVEGGTLSANGSILLGKVLFGKCFSRKKTDLGALGGCTPEDSVDGVGTVLTQKITGLVVSHGGEPVVLFKPDTGTLLAALEMPECAIGTVLEVRGELVLQDAGGKASFGEHKLTHLIREFTGLQLMKVGENLVTIDGTANVTLESPHDALKWAGLSVNAACWGYINPTTKVLSCFSKALEAKPEVKIEGEAATLLVGNVDMEATCKTAAFVEGGTLSADDSILLGKVLFGGCFSRKKTDLGALAACTPKDKVDGLGTVVTQNGTGLIVLHGGEPVVLFKPVTGELLAIVEMPECAVATMLEVKGELVLQDAGGKAAFEKHAKIHLIAEFTGLQLMKVGGILATIDGSAEVALGGAHTGYEWAGLGP